ncbi:MAG: methyltransferase domain-containing protein [Acidobacteria bacterium]|nr:methyltransferase domain-containing protein [Acidobacteriota bacterium]
MSTNRKAWIPALGRWRSVPFYESVVRWFSLEDLPRLIARDLELAPGQRTLDIGCGPGSLERAVAAVQPAARVVGLDPDPDMLRRARADGWEGARFVGGLGQTLPFADASMDRVTMTLMLHHLTRPRKQLALAEALRVLRPGGRLLLTDWTKPRGPAAAAFLIVRVVDGFEPTADHAHGRVEELITGAGFRELRRLHTRRLWIGEIAHFAAVRPH